MKAAAEKKSAAEALRDKIEAAAERLGATRNVIYQWRIRGMSAEWRLKLLADPKSSFTVKDFDRAAQVGTRQHRPRGQKK